MSENEKDTGMGPHITGLVSAVAMGIASGNAGIAALGYAGGNLGHRVIRDAIPSIKEDLGLNRNRIARQENPDLRNKTQLGKYGK